MTEWPSGVELYANWIDFEGWELVVRQGIDDEFLQVGVYRPGAMSSRYQVALTDDQVADLIDTLVEYGTKREAFDDSGYGGGGAAG